MLFLFFYLYKYKLKKRYKTFLSLLHAKRKQREKISSGPLLFFIAATYMLENQNGYILPELISKRIYISIN
ncbi:hypothetical protein CON65_05125 [Bacillus pseudomycoides]|uniref:Uncharacterized protein n=1 Tax=Bacillus pseudomycoides TaxID=64104 RepID=A0AA91VEP1_9BACI|nr:hypothetical protein COO03_08440 [Bacillus sp. AFS098217]PED83941.1 hypothetical protein CON65_05125 [Bacillus pseudomycoides]PEU14583.1 hypothetical protein CN524_07745 [Bacillus sp. AFS019443]PEU19658.1 hypothetical protein CN525_08000 [Bacillus sp. AFS014408]PFW61727.1 hypothetical protein COL20_16155 [Bacillus sp. AFS075034]